jgi:tetratricopeptide (TPR) repeat protein
MSEIIFREGLELLDNKEFEPAINKFSLLLDKEPNHIQGLFCRAICYRNTGKLELSIADFSKAISLQKDNADIYAERAVSQLHLKQPQLAIIDFEKAKELEPENPYRYSSLGFAYSRIRNIEKSIEYYEHAVKLDPEDAVSYNNLAVIHEQKGNMDKSRELGKKADELTDGPIDGRPKSTPPPSAASISNLKTPKGGIDINPENNKPSKRAYSNVIKNVLTNNQEFKSFIKFIKNGFKIKK